MHKNKKRNNETHWKNRDIDFGIDNQEAFLYLISMFDINLVPDNMQNVTDSKYKNC